MLPVQQAVNLNLAFEAYYAWAPATHSLGILFHIPSMGPRSSTMLRGKRPSHKGVGSGYCCLSYYSGIIVASLKR
ncbi:hypothetical protein F5Y04DRAFT_253035 [Hypomontagnella monticulosa]|nr:hypothetical protein F5Y04DRAFT_253035 [Hypomontagnella monticulosa]